MASGSRRSRMIAANRSQIVAMERLGGAARRHDAVVVELEDVAQVGPRVGIVLDHQDVDRAASSSMGSSVRGVSVPRLLDAILGQVAPAS